MSVTHIQTDSHAERTLSANFALLCPPIKVNDVR